MTGTETRLSQPADNELPSAEIATDSSDLFDDFRASGLFDGGARLIEIEGTPYLLSYTETNSEQVNGPKQYIRIHTGLDTETPSLLRISRDPKSPDTTSAVLQALEWTKVVTDDGKAEYKLARVDGEEKTETGLALAVSLAARLFDQLQDPSVSSDIVEKMEQLPTLPPVRKAVARLAITTSSEFQPVSHQLMEGGAGTRH